LALKKEMVCAKKRNPLIRTHFERAGNREAAVLPARAQTVWKGRIDSETTGVQPADEK
jgi:hypothetical protein